MGTPAYAVPSFLRLANGRHRVVGVVTRPDRPAGRGKRMQAGAVKQAALEQGVPVLAPESARDPELAAGLAALRPDLGVVVAYGRILPKAVLEIPRLGCINAHGSLLPQLRGAAPIERAILEGLQQTGVTIMEMNEGLDEGDILSAASVPITARTDAGALRQGMAELSAGLLCDAADAMADGELPRTPQDHGLATYAPPLRREEAALDWTQAAYHVDCRVRAFSPSPGAFTFEDGRRLKILQATVLADDDASASAGAVLAIDDDAMIVSCGKGSLSIAVVQPEGRRAMSAADYSRGLRGDGRQRQLSQQQSVPQDSTHARD